MRKILFGLLVLGVAAALIVGELHTKSTEQTPLEKLSRQYARRAGPSVDHTKFAQLQARFKKPQEVTSACIACHNGRDEEVMRSSHWNWERTEYIPGQGIRSVGKKNLVNNFCIGVTGNEPSCNRCHAGYGYAEASFDFTNPLNVDCLSCHDNSGEYTKAAGGAGMPDPSVDLARVAQRVGKPQRLNCGTCHFLGGGGNNVKHGDLETALLDSPKTVDVHMGTDGLDMECVDCHTASKHQMLGKMYSVSSMNRNRVECETCHSTLPHADGVLNSHTLKVACQTCHIPVYAKVNPTKLTWDWSTAGRLQDGKPIEEKGPHGEDTYLSIKGSFTWGTNVKPEYIWFNGTASHYLIGDRIDPSRPVKINTLHGSYDDPDAKIYPVKIHRGKQIYDAEYRYLIQPKLVSTVPGDGGYWTEFDWPKANEEGMRLVGLPYSGKYGFVETEMTWPVNHMVSPTSQTVGCNECHTRKNGRLAAVGGFYLPGRDRNGPVDAAGVGLLAATLAGVCLHGAGRAVAARRKRRAMLDARPEPAPGAALDAQPEAAADAASETEGTERS
ncbi:MAG TPA: tetrathionate reductase family octaheme c-type cytochrome [Vicinamibacterales bacterium]|nr:tetrathionate reductase family octaheme c-type cytochrome [Vicinamibacterales bacterium]HPW21746.1 tetrathionate reductase family octaheme c-type cytochrome [Vicinamibacterales bacterium]